MGRRKIEILPIQHDRNRSVTFLKRKNGLFKKAYELGVLCSVDVAVIIFGHNNKVYEYCSTDSDTMVQRRLHYTGERDTKTPADFGGDKANNDDDEDGSDDAGPSRNGKFPMNGKKRGRDDEHLDYDTPGHLLHLQQHLQRPNGRGPSAPSLPNISSLARGPMPPVPPVSLPIPPYHPHHPSLPQPQSTVDALMEREREREREREGALRQLGPQHLLNNQQASQFAPHPSHPSLVPNLNIAALLQANPLLGLGVPGLNLGIGGLLGAGAGAGGAGGNSQQDLLAMLSANAANVGQSNALYSNPLFSTLFPNHPNLGQDTSNSNDSPHKPASTGRGGGDIWPSLACPEPSSNSNTSSAPVSSSNANSAGDTSWLSFLGNPRGSQPPTDDVDWSSLFSFDGGIGAGAHDGGDDDERGGKRRCLSGTQKRARCSPPSMIGESGLPWMTPPS